MRLLSSSVRKASTPAAPSCFASWARRSGRSSSFSASEPRLVLPSRWGRRRSSSAAAVPSRVTSFERCSMTSWPSRRSTLAVRRSSGNPISMASSSVQLGVERPPRYRVGLVAVVLLDVVGPEPDVLGQLVPVLQDPPGARRGDGPHLVQDVLEQVRVLVL